MPTCGLGQTEENSGRPPHSSMVGLLASGITKSLAVAAGFTSLTTRGSSTGFNSVASTHARAVSAVRGGERARERERERERESEGERETQQRRAVKLRAARRVTGERQRGRC